jgi:hypothetical protein
MPIDPKIEQSTRTMIGHAMRHELEELNAFIAAERDETVLGVIGLCVLASGYIAIDVCEQWPTEADRREIATKAAIKLDVAESDVYEFLSRVALGDERLNDVFPMPKAHTLPLLIVADLLAAFRHREKQWWEYLDQIWDAAETAQQVRIAILPALMLRAHKESGVAAAPDWQMSDGNWHVEVTRSAP